MLHFAVRSRTFRMHWARLCAVLVGLLLANSPSEAETTTQISQYGFTWTFDQPVQSGQFATGDYWVVGPVKITSITPASVHDAAGAVAGAINGSMINPGWGKTQGYDARMFDTYGYAYSDSLNVGLNVSAANPLVVTPGSSLISSLSKSPALTTARPRLQAAAVLTVLDVAPAAGSFRPAYVGSDKTVQFTESDLRYDLLPSLPKPASAPNIQTTANKMQRPWFDHVSSWTGRYAHPTDNMPDYGRDMSLIVSDLSESLMLDYADTQKRDGLVRMVQYGIDSYGILKNGGVWEDLGGHMHGRKLPILLAGLVLEDPEMLAIGIDYPNAFQEDRQTFYVSQADIDRVPYTGDGRPRDPYDASFLGVAEWGEQHTRAPQRDGSNWDVSYRRLVGRSLIGQVLTAKILGLEDEWNHPALFDYMDRYWLKEMDRYTSPGYSAGSDTDRLSAFNLDMWSAYSNYIVPEPSSLALFALGIPLLLSRRRA